MKPNVVAFIFARGGSKGVPRKNIRLLDGKPLIAYSIEVARRCPSVSRVIVSTDDAEIAHVARECGAEVPFMRPAELARDDSPEWLAWRHAIAEVLRDGPLDVFLSVPTTSPLRAVEDVEACVRVLLEGAADVVVTVRPAERNPYFNMVTLDNHGCASLVIKPDADVQNRQAAPRMFDLTTVAYAARPEFVMKARTLFEGRVKTVLVPAERALDIDTLLDFEMAEFLMQRRRGKG